MRENEKIWIQVEHPAPANNLFLCFRAFLGYSQVLQETHLGFMVTIIFGLVW
jgi:hypothetical protein